jgi:hypothetical protein
MCRGTLRVERKLLHARAGSHRPIMVTLHNMCAVLTHKIDARTGIRVVPNDVAQAVDGFHVSLFDNAQRRLQRVQVCMNIRENSQPHRTRGLERWTVNGATY